MEIQFISTTDKRSIVPYSFCITKRKFRIQKVLQRSEEFLKRHTKYTQFVRNFDCVFAITGDIKFLFLYSIREKLPIWNNMKFSSMLRILITTNNSNVKWTYINYLSFCLTNRKSIPNLILRNNKKECYERQYKILKYYNSRSRRNCKKVKCRWRFLEDNIDCNKDK